MIARLAGTVWAVGEEHLVVRTGGVGFQVTVPAPVLQRWGEVGQSVELFTYLNVRENELSLYGFLTAEDLALFRLLLSISGVGPKVALALLGTLSPQTLRQAVAHEDEGVLSQVSGIGPKTAKAIIFHLKDKLAAPETGPAPRLRDGDADVIAALTGLGFSLVEAQTALQSLPQDEDLSVEERVRLALAYFASS
jgi:Holliday junction DNA helicase RuvA